MQITIFYDSRCPLCAEEMKQLRKADVGGVLRLEDLHQHHFTQRFSQIDPQRAMAILHGLNSRGELVLGLDVTVMAWSAVGKHRWLAVLRWPGIRWFADKAYLFFAKHRQALSSLFGKVSCSEGSCYVPAKRNSTAPKNCVRNVDEDAEF